MEAQHDARVHWVSKPVHYFVHAHSSVTWGLIQNNMAATSKLEIPLLDIGFYGGKKAKRKITTKFTVIIVAGGVCAHTHPSFVSCL